MSFQHSSFPLRLLMPLLSATMLAQQSTSITALNELGPENAAIAQRAGLWDVIETTWASPTSTPTKKNLVAERRMVGSFLEEVLEPAPNSAPAEIKRIDYLSFNRIEGRWKYVSMDTRAPVGLMSAASDDRGENGSIHLTFEPFAIPIASTNITGQLVLMQQFIVLDGPDHDRKDQYFSVADGSGKSWLGHRYEYVRRHAQ
jgi:hypothetical protein